MRLFLYKSLLFFFLLVFTTYYMFYLFQFTFFSSDDDNNNSFKISLVSTSPSSGSLESSRGSRGVIYNISTPVKYMDSTTTTTQNHPLFIVFPAQYHNNTHSKGSWGKDQAIVEMIYIPPVEHQTIILKILSFEISIQNMYDPQYTTRKFSAGIDTTKSFTLFVTKPNHREIRDADDSIIQSQGTPSITIIHRVVVLHVYLFAANIFHFMSSTIFGVYSAYYSAGYLNYTTGAPLQYTKTFILPPVATPHCHKCVEGTQQIYTNLLNIEYLINSNSKKSSVILPRDVPVVVGTTDLMYIGFDHMEAWQDYNEQSKHAMKLMTRYFVNQILQTNTTTTTTTNDSLDYCDSYPKERLVAIISRQGTTRRMQNEKQLFIALEQKRNFNVVCLHLEQMTLAEQIEVICRTTVMVGLHGAGLINALYLPTNAVLIEVHSTITKAFTAFHNLANIKNIHYRTVLGELPTSGTGRQYDWFYQEVIVDIPNLISVIEQALSTGINANL